jgi:hypothetical protein
MLQNMPDQKGKKAKVTNEMVNNVAYNAISRLYNQRTLERMKALATGEEIVEETLEEVEVVDAEIEVDPEVVDTEIEVAPEVVDTEIEVDTEVTEAEVAVDTVVVEAEVEGDTEVAVEEKLEVESSETNDLSETEGKESPEA